MAGRASVAVIILNWKRPQNIGRIVAAASEALPEAALILVDQAEPPDRLVGRTDIPFERCWVRVQANQGPVTRFELAASLPFDHCLCIDDDMFLTPEQIRAVMDALAAEPDSAHGVTGQIIRVGSDGRTRATLGSRFEGQVSVLHQVYAFHRRRLGAMLALAQSLGYACWEDIGLFDDILLSCAGPSRSHYVGPIDRCPTSNTPGVALVSSPDFRELRSALRARLIREGKIFVLHSSEPIPVHYGLPG